MDARISERQIYALVNNLVPIGLNLCLLDILKLFSKCVQQNDQLFASQPAIADVRHDCTLVLFIQVLTLVVDVHLQEERWKIDLVDVDHGKFSTLACPTPWWRKLPSLFRTQRPDTRHRIRHRHPPCRWPLRRVRRTWDPALDAPRNKPPAQHRWRGATRPTTPHQHSIQWRHIRPCLEDPFTTGTSSTRAKTTQRAKTETHDMDTAREYRCGSDLSIGTLRGFR